MATRLFEILESGAARRLALLLLRVAMGGLLVWWGLAKVIQTGLGKTISETFYGGAFSLEALLIGFGVVQAAAGAAIMLGLFRRPLYLFQLAVNAFTAAAVWYAIVDPFKWWLPAQTEFPFTQLFYPSAIILAASLTLMAFRAEDRWSLDARRDGG